MMARAVRFGKGGFVIGSAPPMRGPRTRGPYQAIVVGAGHNGLTAAAYLARAGLHTLVLERRETVGGCCVTEEIAPGCRASTAAYVASMLRPEVIRDLRLRAHGLRMVPCSPALLVPFADGSTVAWWPDRERTVAGLRALSAGDADTFVRVDDDLKRLARYLQPFFLEPPPDVHARGLAGAREALRVARRFRGISGDEIARMITFLTGSLGSFLDRHYESEKVKTLFLANNVYGKHGGPYQPGTALGLLFHLLSGGEHEEQGFYGHVIGGMGAITQAMAAAAAGFGAEIRTAAAVARVDVGGGRVRGVVLEDGSEIASPTVLSNADPKRTFLGLVDPGALPPEFVRAVRGIRMDGPCAKVNLVLSAEPLVRGMPPEYGAAERALFTLVPSLEFAERSYEAARRGELPAELWVDCVVASNVDPTLAPAGRHVMTCFVQYVPYRLREGTWDDRRAELGRRVIATIAEYAPNVPGAVEAMEVLTPLDLERRFGLTEGNIFHGDLALEHLFFMRPVPGWAGYRTPVEGLYLCGAGAHPGGGVTGAPGHNAARQVLRDLRRRPGAA
jgi:phytoene dehydrogenase-like protein